MVVRASKTIDFLSDICAIVEELNDFPYFLVSLWPFHYWFPFFVFDWDPALLGHKCLSPFLVFQLTLVHSS